MVKTHTTITIDADLWSAAKARIHNLSGFVEGALKSHLVLVDNIEEQKDKLKPAEVARNTIMHLRDQLRQCQKEKLELQKKLEICAEKYKALSKRTFRR